MGLYDAHVHLDFMANAREVALDAGRRGLRLFANTVTPQGFVRTRELVGDLDNVDVGLGQHPWWVGQADLGLFDELEPRTSWVGEVGLDFSPRRAEHGRQVEVFRHIARRCALSGGKTLSIHAVRSAGAVLDVLEETGCLESNRCILHWFSGSTEELWRAIRAGCWFSVNETQAGTRRAKEQLRLIPGERLLFETDLPPTEGEVFSAERIESSLLRAQGLADAIRRR